ncbi:MAG: hypothetical protein ACPL6C_02570 [bacterium]
MGLSTFSSLLNFAIENEKKGLNILNKLPSADREKLKEFIEESEKSIAKLETILRENVTEMVMEPCEPVEENDYAFEETMGDSTLLAIRIKEKQRDFLLELARVINLKEVKRAVEKLASNKNKLIEKYKGA